MGTVSPRNLCYKAVCVLEGVTSLIFVVVAAANEVDDLEWWRSQFGNLAGGMDWIQSFDKPLTLIVAVVLSALEVTRRKIGPPWVRSAIHEMLDVLWELAFGPRASVSAHHFHRVTLFKHRKWRFWFCRWPWSGWLIPVERSGNLMRKTRTAFRAPDSGNAEGVAGQTWILKRVLLLESLPDVAGTKPKPVVLDDYCGKTWTERSWLTDERRERAGRSFVGIPVQTPKCKDWGVIVLDSRDSARIPNMGFGLPFARVLGKLIERI